MFHPESWTITSLFLAEYIQSAPFVLWCIHYDEVTMGAIASQITSLTIVYSTVYSGVDQSKHQSSASLAFVWGIHRGPVNAPHKWPVTRKMFPFDDVIMDFELCCVLLLLFWAFYPYTSRLLHFHQGNHMIDPVLLKMQNKFCIAAHYY